MIEPFAGVIELRALVDALPFDVWARDREQVCVYANPHAQRRWPSLLGSTPEVGGGRPETVAIWRANNARAMAGEVVRGEVRYEHEGRLRTYVNFVAPVYQGAEVVGTAGVNLDVTDLREREQEVVRLQALVQGIFDNAPIAIGLRGVQGDDLVHLADNPKIAALFGRAVDDLVGKTDLELGVDEADVRRAISRFRQARAAQVPLPFEATYESKEGPRTMVGRVAPLPEAAGVETYVFIGEDVTEQRALEASLLHADRLASLGTMAAGIAHEINNPLAYVQATLHFCVQQLEASLRKPAGQRDVGEATIEDLRTSLVGVERIGALVREMLTVARRPARPVAGQTADVRRTVQSVLGLAASRLRAVAQVTEDVGDVPPVTADALRLGQVLMNLVTNALQAFESARRQGRIWIRARALDDATVVLTVEDDGPGIPEEQRERLFAPFQTGRADGHGLGLFLCRRLVSEMGGGTIVAEPRPGGGTTMKVTLPVASERRDPSFSAVAERAGE